MKSEEIKTLFAQLRMWKTYQYRAPHKPLLVIWAIGRCLRGEDRLVNFSEAHASLTQLINQFGTRRKSVHPEYPFWRLQADNV